MSNVRTVYGRRQVECICNIPYGGHSNRIDGVGEMPVSYWLGRAIVIRAESHPLVDEGRMKSID